MGGKLFINLPENLKNISHTRSFSEKLKHTVYNSRLYFNLGEYFDDQQLT